MMKIPLAMLNFSTINVMAWLRVEVLFISGYEHLSSSHPTQKFEILEWKKPCKIEINADVAHSNNMKS